MNEQPNSQVQVFDETSPACTPQILSPQNSSYEIARNILLLDSHLDVTGLEFPAAVLYKGVYHSFDFYCVHKECVIKILRHFEVSELRQLVALSEIVDVLVVIDGEDARCGECDGCADDDLCEQVMRVGEKIGAYILQDGVIYAYYEDASFWDEAEAD